MASNELGPEWDSFEQDGHVFVRAEGEVWRCGTCGSTKDRNNYSGLPDDSWAKLTVGGRTYCDVDTCEAACLLAVMES
jgi:hypothetical protein